MMNQRQRTWTPRTKAAYARARAERSARPLLALLDPVGERNTGGGLVVRGREEDEEAGDMCKMALLRMVAEENEGMGGDDRNGQQQVQLQQNKNKRKKMVGGL